MQFVWFMFFFLWHCIVMHSTHHSIPSSIRLSVDALHFLVPTSLVTLSRAVLLLLSLTVLSVAIYGSLHYDELKLCVCVCDELWHYVFSCVCVWYVFDILKQCVSCIHLKQPFCACYKSASASPSHPGSLTGHATASRHCGGVFGCLSGCV